MPTPTNGLIYGVCFTDAIGYVGHSQGTTLMFALLASQPETYSTLIRPFVALAPAVAMSTGTFGLLDHFFQ